MPTSTLPVALVTPDALDAALALPVHQRAQLVSFLSRPRRRSNWRPVHQLARFRVLHAHAPKQVVVCIRPVADRREYCAIHIGLHDAFDTFSKTYDGQLPCTLLSIQETELMAKQSKNNAQATNVTSLEQHAETCNRFVAAIFEPLQILAKAAAAESKNDTDDTIHLLDEGVHEHGKQIKDLQQQIQVIDADLKGSQEELNEYVERVAKSQESSTADVAGQAAQLNHLQGQLQRQMHTLETCRNQLANLAASQHSCRAELSHCSTRTAAVEEQLEIAQRDWTALKSAVDSELERRTWNHTVRRLLVAVRRIVGELIGRPAGSEVA